MPTPSLLQVAGAQAQKPSRYVPIFTSRFLNGYYTNRNLLRSPLSAYYADGWHLGATDVLCDGLNTELSNRLTLIRRPGNEPFSTAIFASAPDTFYSFHQSTGTIEVIVDTAAEVSILTPTANTMLFIKTAGSGQSYFSGVNKTMYIGDGIDLVKYIPGVINPISGLPIWNWGIAAPIAPPSIVITQTGSANNPWRASVVYSTMGLLVDSNGNVQQLISVNADGSNPPTTNSDSQYGLSGNGMPAWDQTPGSTLGPDGNITWVNAGPVVAWIPHTTFNEETVGGTLARPMAIYDPATAAVYINAYIPGHPGSGTTGAIRPNFTGVNGSRITDGSCVWFCINNPTIKIWLPNFPYPAGGSLYYNWIAFAIVEPVNLPAPNNQMIFIHRSSGGISGAGGIQPLWATSPGLQTADNQLMWLCLGSATRQNATAVTAWMGAGQGVFSVIEDGGIFYVCSQSGITDTAPPTFNAHYGDHTTDGTAQWVCVGNSLSWATNTTWHLPVSGFAPPQPSDAYGGSSVLDSNSNSQFAIASGLSGGVAPTWNTVGSTTTDNAITWLATSAFTANSFSWTKGYGYCYSYKARANEDPLSPVSVGGEGVIPNLQTVPLPAPIGSRDGSVSTASPMTQIIGPNAGAVNTISGIGSTDPQVDTIMIFRSLDGFFADGPYLYLTEISNPTPIGGLAQPWSFKDYMPDIPTSVTLPGLNPLIEAPVDETNDPPPGQAGNPINVGGLINVVYHQGRLWGSVGNTVFASGGPETSPGNGFTAWPPANNWTFQSNVTRLLPTPSGLLVFTTTDLQGIFGGPNILTYYPQLIVSGLGLLSWNALTTFKGTPYLFTADSQLLGLDLNAGGITRVGSPIGDKLSHFDPTKVYLTNHTFGDLDHALFIGDGSTGWYRCNPSPEPDSMITGPVWSPKANIVGGCKALISIETAPGVHQLLIGPGIGGGSVLARDSTFTVFTDNGQTYPSWLTMGNIVLAQPGQIADVAFIECDYAKVGTSPQVSILLDELFATVNVPFENISNYVVSDPPKKYGETGQPETMFMNRYYLSQSILADPKQEPVPTFCKSMQVKIDFGATDVIQNEVLSFTVFGSLLVER